MSLSLRPEMTLLSEQIIDTPLATIQRTAPDLVEVRFKPVITLTVAGIGSILEARETLGRSGPHRALIVMSPDMDFEMSMITTDHYAQRPVTQLSTAVAWVTTTPRNEQFTRLYFAYFPSPVPSAIFMREAEARDWLAGFVLG